MRTLPDAERVATALPASNVGSASSQPAGKLAVLEAAEQLGARRVRRLPRREGRVPGRARVALALADGARVREHLVVDREARLGVEAELDLEALDLVGAHGRAVDAAGVLLGRRRVADDRAQRDDRRLAGLGLGGLDRGVQRVDVLRVAGAAVGPVDPLGVPAVRRVAREDVLGERDVRVVLDGDLVVVPDDDEVAELLVAGERGRLARHALLQVAVGRDDVDVVVERRLARGGRRVQQTALAAGREGHADGGREALAERAGRDLDAPGVLVLGVAGGLGAPRAQGLDVRHLQAVPGEEELEVDRERRVARREHEPVAADPVVVRRVVAHDLLEQEVGGRRQRDRGAGVAVAHLLHRVGGERLDRLDGPVVQVRPVQGRVSRGQRVHRTSFPSGARAPDPRDNSKQPLNISRPHASGGGAARCRSRRPRATGLDGRSDAGRLQVQPIRGRRSCPGGAHVLDFGRMSHNRPARPVGPGTGGDVR